jgi:hypothetical protein
MISEQSSDNVHVMEAILTTLPQLSVAGKSPIHSLGQLMTSEKH